MDPKKANHKSFSAFSNNAMVAQTKSTKDMMPDLGYS